MKRWLIDDNKWVITVHAASLSLQIWFGQQPNWFPAEKQLIIERALSEDVIDLQRALLEMFIDAIVYLSDVQRATWAFLMWLK